MNTEGGEVVKFEFDPTIKAAVYSSDQTIPRLKAGDTVILKTGLSDATVRPSTINAADWEALKMSAGTVVVYVGPTNYDSDGNAANGQQAFDLGINAANQVNYRDRTLWHVTSEPVGFVDYANSRISVYDNDNEATNWVVVTEDTVDYSPRRGNSIGGLDADKTYFIIQLEDDPTPRSTRATTSSSRRPSALRSRARRSA
jgi:hypothetical protein